MVEKVFFTLNHIQIKWFANMKTLAGHSLQLVWRYSWHIVCTFDMLGMQNSSIAMPKGATYEDVQSADSTLH